MFDQLPKVAGTEETEFRSAGVLTLGVEIELQIMHRQSHNLASIAEDLLQAGAHIDKLKPEFYLSTVEINTDKCDDVHAVSKDLTESLDLVTPLGEKLGVQFATTGCHPFSRYADCIITPTPRYTDMIDRNQWLVRRMTVYGMHVHIGMKSGDDCIRFNNFFLHFLPHLLALSASSPFWQGDDTGLASCRPTTYEALPTAGQPYQVRNWAEFESLFQTLKRCGSIQTLKDLWWDLRPSPHYGTLEIRVCDGLATLSETLAVVSFIHLLAHWFHENGTWLDEMPPPSRWIARENKWRVMRYGLDAELVTNIDGATKQVRQDIEDWLEKLKPFIEKLGYQAYVEDLRQICQLGNSSCRQRKIFAQGQSLQQVAAFNAQEFLARKPDWTD